MVSAARTDREPLVQATDLRRTYGDKAVVDGVSLSLAAGTVSGFLGANGAGKTTVIRVMLGLIRGEGRTTYLGRPLAEWRSPATVVGAVLGGVAGHPKRRVGAHLRMVAAGVGAPDSRVDELLDKVGLTATAGARLSGLSLGMAQRLGIAQALLGDPPVLILDEPANGLDPHSIRWLRDMLRELAQEGRAVLVSSHLLTEMEHMADRVVVLSRGKVVTEASIADIRARVGSIVNVQSPRSEELARVVRGKGATAEPAGPGQIRIAGLNRFQVGDLAADHGIVVHWLDEQAQSLEEFYLSVAEQEFKAG